MSTPDYSQPGSGGEQGAAYREAITNFGEQGERMWREAQSAAQSPAEAVNIIREQIHHASSTLPQQAATSRYAGTPNPQPSPGSSGSYSSPSRPPEPRMPQFFPPYEKRRSERSTLLKCSVGTVAAFIVCMVVAHATRPTGGGNGSAIDILAALGMIVFALITLGLWVMSFFA